MPKFSIQCRRIKLLARPLLHAAEVVGAVQAIARSHRLGQMREVKVSKLIMKMRAPGRETVEERIMQMQVTGPLCMYTTTGLLTSALCAVMAVGADQPSALHHDETSRWLPTIQPRLPRIVRDSNMHVQEDKRQIAEAALTDGMAGQQQRLSYAELRRLFGLAR